MRRSKIITPSIFVIIFLLLAFLPTVLSTQPGTRFLTQVLNRFLPGTVEIGKAQLTWFGKQTISDLSYKDAENREILSIERVTTRSSLPRLIFRSLKETTIDQLTYTLYQESLDKKSTFPHFAIHGPLYLNQGLIIIHSDKEATSYIQNIHIETNAKNKLFQLTAEGMNGAQKGTLTAHGSFTYPRNVEVEITHFPLIPLGAFQELAWLPSALGSDLSATLSLTETESSPLTISAVIESSFLSAKIKGQEEDRFLVISPESTIEWQLTPPFFQKWFSLSQDNALFLADKSKFTIQLQKIAFPLFGKKLSFDQALIEASLKTETLTLVYKDKGYVIHNVEARLLQENGHLTLDYQGNLQNNYNTALVGHLQQERPGSFHLTAQLDRMPNTVVESISGLKGAITPYGKFFTISLNLIKEPDDLHVTLQMNTDRAKLTSEIKGKKLNHLAFSLKGEIFFEGNRRDLFGNSIALDLKGRLALEKGAFTFASIRGKAENPYLDVVVEGTLGKEGTPFSWNLVDIRVNGALQAPPVFANSGAEELKKSHPLSLHLEGADNEILFDLDLSLLKANGKVQGFIHEERLDFSKADWSFIADAKDFPVVVVDTLLAHKHDLLPTLIGPRVSFHADIAHRPQVEPHTLIQINALAEGVVLQAAMTIDGTLVVSQETPSFLQYQITPKRLNRILQEFFPNQPAPPFLLSEKSTLDFTINSFTCPTQYPGTIRKFVCKSGFSGELSVSPMLFVNAKDHRSFTIEKISGTIAGKDFSEAISLQLGALFHNPSERENQKSHLYFNGDLLYPFTSDGELDRLNAELKGEWKLESLPTEMIFGIIPLEPSSREVAKALFGDFINGSAHIDIKQHQGPVTLSLQASNFKATAPLYLTQENRLQLREKFEAEIELTHKINETLIKDINPLLISGVYSTHPLRLEIPAGGLSLPLFPFTLQGVFIQNAILDIGKIDVVYGGELQKIMEFVKSEQPSESGVMSAWFTPIYFSLKEGNLMYDRFDLLLAGNVHLAFWGKIDLTKDKVRMMMAIGADTLQRSFDIKGLTSKEMFHVKMRGSTTNLELDWSAAKRRLGVIIAASAGGPIGSLVGTVLEKIVTSLGDTPSPPPTTQPFPWDS